jgi:nitroimidazol reductase NimA-like FMN-containing flavoprotein (pyridoxamine 5'-phosphate oxidase superfamily)
MRARRAKRSHDAVCGSGWRVRRCGLAGTKGLPRASDALAPGAIACDAVSSAVMIDVDALIRLQEASFARAQDGLRSSWPRDSGMDAAQLRSFLDGHRYCVLATTTARLHPAARPVAFTVIGASFWFATVAGPRLRNLERTPWASIVVAEGDAGEHRAVAVDGPATITRQPSEQLLAAWEARQGSRAEWAAAWFEIRPTRLISYSAKNEP